MYYTAKNCYIFGITCEVELFLIAVVVSRCSCGVKEHFATTTKEEIKRLAYNVSPYKTLFRFLKELNIYRRIKFLC